MKSFTVLIVVALSLSILPAALGAEPISGTIQGNVLDVDNSPLAGASVNIRQLISTQQGSRTVVTTDSLGRFQLTNVGVGTYIVAAFKDSTGIHNPHAFVAPNTAFAVIAIGSGSPTATMVLRLGKRTGVLVGHVSDSVTGAPMVTHVAITLASSGVTWLSAAVPPDYRISVPSDVALIIQISAPGYQIWNYSISPGQPASTLTLHGAEKKTLPVLLQPLS